MEERKLQSTEYFYGHGNPEAIFPTHQINLTQSL